MNILKHIRGTVRKSFGMSESRFKNKIVNWYTSQTIHNNLVLDAGNT